MDSIGFCVIPIPRYNVPIGGHWDTHSYFIITHTLRKPQQIISIENNLNKLGITPNIQKDADNSIITFFLSVEDFNLIKLLGEDWGSKPSDFYSCLEIFSIMEK